MAQVTTQNHLARIVGLSSKAILPSLLLLPVVAAMLVAVIVAGVAGYENFRFVRGLDQYLNLIGVAQNYARLQPGFAQQPGEDILAMLARNGQITAMTEEGKAARIINPWGGEMHAMLSEPSILRIDAILPLHACRRLGMSFVKNAREFGVLEFAVHNGDEPWRLTYNGNIGRAVSESEILQICGSAANVAVITTVRLR